MAGCKVPSLGKLELAHDFGCLAHGEELDSWRDEPRRCPDSVHQLRDICNCQLDGDSQGSERWRLTGLQLWDNLNTRGAVANDGDLLALAVKVFGPGCTVDELALEVVQTRDVRPFPVAVAVSIWTCPDAVSSLTLEFLLR